MSISPCLEPACPSPATYRGRCQRHAKQRDRSIDRAGYHVYRSARWRHTRSRYLAAHTICERCDDAIAEHVHHVVDLKDGGDVWSESNLQALCARCHNRETRRRQVVKAGEGRE